jgi:hypothetical protein
MRSPETMSFTRGSAGGRPPFVQQAGPDLYGTSVPGDALFRRGHTGHSLMDDMAGE